MTESTAMVGQYLAQLTPGSGDERLPPERELALQLDMSRQALREGMTHFVAKARSGRYMESGALSHRT